ncbi:MAG: hypothetical protein R3B46_12545 [Phycisphaerales bacterium]
MHNARLELGSMFVRRVALLAACFSLVLSVLGVRAWQLTITQGSDLLAASESRLTRERWTPTVRARILDRKGRVLAMDAPAYDLQVGYALITGNWAMNEAARIARAENRERWSELSREQREAIARGYLPACAAQAESFWDGLASTLGVDRAAIDARRDEIREEVQRVASTVWARRLEKERSERAEATLLDVNDPVAEQAPDALHTIWRGLTGDQYNEVARLAAPFGKVLTLLPAGARTYPYESVAVEIDRSSFPAPMRNENMPVQSVQVRGVATHIVGWLHEVDADHLDARPRSDPASGAIDRGYYEVGDLAGRNGIEEGYEDRLRGLRGLVVYHRDTGEEEVEPAVAGEDVQLTLDVMLQARIQALLAPEVGLATVQPFHEGNQGLAPPAGNRAQRCCCGSRCGLGRGSRDGLQPQLHAQTWCANRISRSGMILFVCRGSTARSACHTRPVRSSSHRCRAAVTEGVHALKTPIECHGHFWPNNPDAPLLDI